MSSSARRTVRPEAGLSIEVASCDLAEVVRDVGARFEDAMRGEGRALTVVAPPRLPGRWDATRLDQLVSNLVANAVRHAGRGSVTITAAAEENAAVVTVADSGPGIPSSEHARIFDAFAQGRRAGAGGLGLGLYVARSIVQAHRGRISLSSAEGRGTSFRVELPLDATPGDDVRPPAPADDGLAAAVAR
jgi:signal transduction histidine kinase